MSSSVFFIDLEAFQHNCGCYIIKELCIMDVDDIFSPVYFMFQPTFPFDKLMAKARRTNNFLTCYRHGLTWKEGNAVFEPMKINLDKRALYYVKDQLDGVKLKTVKHCFPELRITNYNASSLRPVPDNIHCPWRDHHGVNCAYKKCLQLCTHYLSCK